jgi:arylsulfatase A-like enzyme
MAAGLIEALQLGQRGQTDVLAISFSALDVIGHKFGPDSQEVYDALIRLDRTLGALFDALDAQVGHDRWAMALTADHGVAPIPEARRRTGESAGRIPTRQIAEAVEAALHAELGPGPHVARVDYSEVYLTDATRRALADTPASDRVMASAVAAILKVPGVARAWRASEVAGQRQHEDPVVRMVANGHHPARSGDLVVVSQPYWFFVTGPTPASGDGTTHGTYHDYDVAVPLIFMGPTFAAARHGRPVTPVDLAPTLAAVVGLDMPGAEGQVLRAAMAP